RLLADPDGRYHPDGLETFNPTTLGRPWHGRVVDFAARHELAAVGNSDAHIASAIGQGHTTFPGRTADDLRQAILERRTHAPGRSRNGARGASNGGRRRSWRARRTCATDEDRTGNPVRIPASRGRQRARPLPVREPPAARPRRPNHLEQPRPAAVVGG